jgi:stage II sporulation protein D
MKRIAIGLTAYDSKNLDHTCVELSASGLSTLSEVGEVTEGELRSAGKELGALPAATVLRLTPDGNGLRIQGLPIEAGRSLSGVILRPRSSDNNLFVQFPPHLNPGSVKRSYGGEIIVQVRDSSLRVFVQCTLEEYLLGVLSSEIPASYHLEAIKAQAVAARTYALNPRTDHHADQCQVCDSFLCCQCYAGRPLQNKGPHRQAIDETKGMVMIYQDQPILALFSACAGGHTENYESCFSDRKTNTFPPPAIAYLRGVREGILPSNYGSPPDEKALSTLWHWQEVDTVDSWAPQFKWSLRLAANSLEATMHHVVNKMLTNNEFAPFVIPPQSAIFGQIDSFEIQSRGVGGTAIAMAVNTSKGTWVFKKELVIRSVFENHEMKLARLKSARIYFEQSRNPSGSLASLSIFGLGSGHGVGMQQTGAEGLARKGNKNYQAILSHYFKGARIAQI